MHESSELEAEAHSDKEHMNRKQDLTMRDTTAEAVEGTFDYENWRKNMVGLVI